MCAYTALKHKKERIEVAEWFMYEDGKTIILISLAHDMRQSHRSPRLLIRRIIIAYFIYLGPDESIDFPRNYFTSRLTIMGHVMQ